ncbi:hypothetical protein MP228_008039 [Amoeboaphelidium protococcarum]|nr:hypothetical protein MP228_008039 [Amoeboaphelidium protococcarum]
MYYFISLVIAVSAASWHVGAQTANTAALSYDQCVGRLHPIFTSLDSINMNSSKWSADNGLSPMYMVNATADLKSLDMPDQMIELFNQSLAQNSTFSIVIGIESSKKLPRLKKSEQLDANATIDALKALQNSVLDKLPALRKQDVYAIVKDVTILDYAFQSNNRTISYQMLPLFKEAGLKYLHFSFQTDSYIVNGQSLVSHYLAHWTSEYDISGLVYGIPLQYKGNVEYVEPADSIWAKNYFFMKSRKSIQLSYSPSQWNDLSLKQQELDQLKLSCKDLASKSEKSTDNNSNNNDGDESSSGFSLSVQLMSVLALQFTWALHLA